MRKWWVAVAACGWIGCKTTEQQVSQGTLDQDLEALRVKSGAIGLNVGLIRGGKLVHTGAYGLADADEEAPMRDDAIVQLASVSKVFVGLAVARAIELDFELDLDADVNEYLGWSKPLVHPMFPETPITLRHLMRHESGLTADGPGDYETYPKPDPSSVLGDYLEDLLAQPAYWEPIEPGEAEEYSNLGTAVAAAVVEQVVGQDFAAFCDQEVFGPLGMTDTHWFYRNYSASQQARIARLHDEAGEPLEHYGFDDWPSGQLRSTVGDLARALIALMDGGRVGGTTFLSTSTLAAFETVTFFIQADLDSNPASFDHSGGEAGIHSYVEYDRGRNGLIILMNHELDDDDPIMDDVEARLRAE